LKEREGDTEAKVHLDIVLGTYRWSNTFFYKKNLLNS
jgi:hypothetical protein